MHLYLHRKKYAPNDELQLISKDIPLIGRALHLELKLFHWQSFWEMTSVLNKE